MHSVLSSLLPFVLHHQSEETFTYWLYGRLWQIHMLDYVLKAADRTTAEGQQEVRVARILLFKVFYDQTEDGILPFIFRLMKTFDVHKQPRRYCSLTK